MFIVKNSKYSIKIPSIILVFYFKKNSLIIFKNKTKIRFLKIRLKLFLILFKNKIFLFNNFLLKITSNFKNKLNYYKNLILSLVKHFLIEMQVQIYSKLNLIGIGYKLFLTDYKQILNFKLGYSHSIYLKLDFLFFNIKFTKLFIISTFYDNLMQIVSLIRLFKLPDPYKSKGINFQKEQIQLKPIKKT